MIYTINVTYITVTMGFFSKPEELAVPLDAYQHSTYNYLMQIIIF